MWDSPMHLLIIAIVVLVLFGGRKIPEGMRGLGQGVREFKDGMRGDQPNPNPPTNTPPSTTTQAPTEEKKKRESGCAVFLSSFLSLSSDSISESCSPND